MIRVAIVDDHALIRDGLRRALARAHDMQVVAEAATMAEARARLGHTAVDVLIIDIGLPDGNGLELCRDQRDTNPELGIVVLTMYFDDKYLLAARDAGASTFIGKGAPSDDLIDAVRAAHQTPQPFAAEGLGDALLRASATEAPTLTTREREVLGLLAEGLGVAGVSRRLFISESTSKTHISKIYTKLGVSNRAQALMTALRLGLVEGPGDERPQRSHPSG